MSPYETHVKQTCVIVQYILSNALQKDLWFKLELINANSFCHLSDRWRNTDLFKEKSDNYVINGLKG